jgi:hypothetical protein
MTKKPVVADAPILLSGAALSDPVGHYMVRGTNPNGSSYTGEVLVTRTGQTFRVLWRIGRQSFVGTGIAEDETIAVSYQAGGRRRHRPLFAHGHRPLGGNMDPRRQPGDRHRRLDPALILTHRAIS